MNLVKALMISLLRQSTGEYFFDPNHIIVKVDVSVELLIKKEPSII